MNERLTEAEAIFHAVNEAPPGEQERILEQRCAGDAEVRALVERLLAHDRHGMGLFLTPPEPANLPPSIGSYRIISRLAEGGMGTVYHAQQMKPMQREVALKVIRAGLDTKEIVARFEAERQALALMDHPNIARVLDAGETERGQPYFVMELIRGIAITEYCDRRRLVLRERLELFRQVCEAVQHAHQKAVIHRDLKPSNVLVAEVDGKPVPKVIDFGVAKAVGRRLTERTMRTVPGMVVGTPEYMSPEHADPENLDLDTRADVYSLGVILYGLMVGTRPFEGGGTLSLLRRIREEEPKRPSTRIVRGESGSAERARVRGTDATALRRLLRGDPDWIVMKALEKERVRRYASPADLSEDIRRYLHEETVAARPPNAGYRTRKFVRRHRLGVAAAAVVVVALVGAVVGTSLALVRARRAEARARTEQERSLKASDFLASTLQGIDPASMAYDLAATLRNHGEKPGEPSAPADPIYEGLNLIDEVRSLVDVGVLDKAVGRIERELKAEPTLASDLYRALGDAYETAESALACRQRAVELSESSRGFEDPTTIALMMELGTQYNRMGRYPEAEDIVQRALEISRRTLGEDARLTIQLTGALGSVYQQRGQAWIALNDLMRRPPRTPWSTKAVPLLREAVERARHVFGEDDGKTLELTNNLTLALAFEGQYAEAEELIRDTIFRMTRGFGENQAGTINARLTLAATLYYSGRVQEAVDLILECQEKIRQEFGENSYIALLVNAKTGSLFLNEGQLDQAEAMLRDAARRAPLILGEQSPVTQEARQSLARLERVKQQAAKR